MGKTTGNCAAWDIRATPQSRGKTPPREHRRRRAGAHGVAQGRTQRSRGVVSLHPDRPRWRTTPMRSPRVRDGGHSLAHLFAILASRTAPEARAAMRTIGGRSRRKGTLRARGQQRLHNRPHHLLGLLRTRLLVLEPSLQHHRGRLDGNRVAESPPLCISVVGLNFDVRRQGSDRVLGSGPVVDPTGTFFSIRC